MSFDKAPLIFQFIVVVLLIILLLVAIVNLVLCVRFNTKKKYVFICVIILIINFVMLLFLMEICIASLNVLRVSNELKWIEKVPLWLATFLIVILAFYQFRV